MLQQEVAINGIQQQSAEEQQRALAMLMKEHEAAIKALADAYEKQEAALTAKIARLEAALKDYPLPGNRKVVVELPAAGRGAR